ncbi:PDZ and LIM domain protein 1-like [Tubulanus polymorphus]|uniref:PDZ and LIM domain protein 1-like n=1 Tax=Tubulanus polymorphus TaxID=672921 RepID=UPI003DA3BB57
MTTMAVTLQRHDKLQPWGFRLQGGRDFRMALSIKKVELNSPAHGYIGPGDMILGIGNIDASQLTHVQAQTAIKQQGNVLHLTVRKGGVLEPPNLKPRGPVKFSAYTASQFKF